MSTFADRRGNSLKNLAAELSKTVDLSVARGGLQPIVTIRPRDTAGGKAGLPIMGLALAGRHLPYEHCTLSDLVRTRYS